MPKDKPTKTQQARETEYNTAAEILLPFFGPKLPEMSNRTPASLVDDVGVLKLIEKDAKKIIGLLNGVIDSKLTAEEAAGLIEVRGETHTMKIIPVTQERLSPEKARTQLRRLAILAGENPDLIIEQCTDDLDMSQHRYNEI